LRYLLSEAASALIWSSDYKESLFEMFMFLYHFVWTFVLIFWVPIVLLLGKNRAFERLALRLPSAFLGEGNIWIHALSVGEVISALPLVKALGQKYPYKDIIFTATTSKGITIARNELEGKVKVLLTMPIDFWWCVRRTINFIKPSIFILVETDIWPGLLDYLRRRGVKSVLVNGRVSPRTLKSYQRFPFFTQMIFDRVDLCLMQSELDTQRLLKARIAPEKVTTVGNIKFDRDWTPMSQGERQELLSALSLKPEDLIWVAGSTHQGEEGVLLEVFKKLEVVFSALRLILAPRKTEQSDAILRQAQNMGLKTILKTDLPKNKDSYDAIILNTLGELGRIYGLSKVSFVGGSLVPIGGHNLLEPASFGCPVLFGPYTHNFDFMSKSLVEAGGGWRVQDGKDLYEAMRMLLEDGGMRTRMGRRAKEFFDGNRGALKQVVSHIEAYMYETRGLQ
jgi:3-deoxy-D-manno-octulosonic-acid transferase